MSPCIRSVVTFSLALNAVFIPEGGAVVSRTNDSELKDSKDAQGQWSLTRSKRQTLFNKFSGIKEAKETKGNNYKYAPDYWPRVPSPAPGPSLNDIIFESSDGQSNGLSRKYIGEAANLLATTTNENIDYITRNTPKYELNRHEQLRILQSYLNRMKLMTTVTVAPKPTSPIWYDNSDVNYLPRSAFIGVMGANRRMMNEDLNQENMLKDIKNQIPKKILEFNRPKIEYTGTIEEKPFKYTIGEGSLEEQMKAYFRRYDPKVVPPNSDRPIQFFNYKYGTTTRRRPRTRRTKAKTTTTTMTPVVKDEGIPDEGDEYYDYTTVDSPSQTQSLPLLREKVKDDDYIDDTTTTRHLLLKNETKNIIVKPGQKLLKTEEDMPEKLDYEPDATVAVAFSTPKDKVIDTLTSGIRKTEIESELVDPELLKDLKVINLNKTLTGDASEVNGDRENETRRYNQEFANLMEVSNIKQTSRKHGEMNEDLKLLQSDDETVHVPTQFKLEKEEDYFNLNTDDIKGLPITFNRRKGKEHNIVHPDAVTNKQTRAFNSESDESRRR